MFGLFKLMCFFYVTKSYLCEGFSAVTDAMCLSRNTYYAMFKNYIFLPFKGVARLFFLAWLLRLQCTVIHLNTE